MVYNATVLIASMLVSNPALYMLDTPRLIRQVKKMIEMNKGDQCKLTQKEANLLCEATPVDPANNISNYMNFMMTCIFYSPIVPMAIPAALIGSFINYWVFKYRLLKTHAMPYMFSRSLGTFFANLIPYMALIWALSFVLLIDK